MQVEIFRGKLSTLTLSLPPRVRETAEHEIARLERTSPDSPHYSLLADYIRWILAIPWKTRATKPTSAETIGSILDEDLLGIESAREQFLELAAWHLFETDRPFPTLCIAGQPGTGKSSLARSIARSLGRKVIEFSPAAYSSAEDLHGEYRQTSGNRPGAIIRGLVECGHMDPVIIIDNLKDDLSTASPELYSAILEVIHPDRKAAFCDRFIDLDVDLSGALMIVTVDATHRVPNDIAEFAEQILLPGYTNSTKLKIAKRFFLSDGIDTTRPSLLKDDAMEEIIATYTNEPGVHQLQNLLGTLQRKSSALKESLDGAPKVGIEEARTLLGPPRITPEIAGRQAEVGIATGLSLQEHGATVQYVETIRMVGDGRLRITGTQLKAASEMIEESLSYIRSHSEDLEIKNEMIVSSDIHIHIPHGVMRSDCRSLSLTVAVALVSLFTEMPVHQDCAFAADTTLRGRVLPVESIREKIFAAHRAGIRRIFLSPLHGHEIERMPSELRKTIEFVYFEDMKDVIEASLVKIILPNRNLDPGLSEMDDHANGK